MGTYSTRMGLFLPAGSDAADVNTIVAAWLKLDGGAGLILCTSSTRPTTNKFPGMYIKETDTGKHYYLDATGTWAAGVYSGGAWIEDSYLTAVTPVGGDVFFGGKNTAGLSFDYAISGTPPLNSYVNAISFSCPTAVANQKIKLKLGVSFAYNGGGSAPVLNWGPYANLKIDGTIVRSNINLWPNPPSGTFAYAVNAIIPIEFEYFETLVASGAHTISLDVYGGGTGGNAPSFCTLRTVDLIATLSS